MTEQEKKEYWAKREENCLKLMDMLSEEDLNAYLEYIPMTQERFERILLACARLDDLSFFVDFRFDYPEYMARLKEKIFITKESNAFFP